VSRQGFRRVGWGPTFRALDTTEVLAAYRRARRRAIFLDWGGTLVPIDNSSVLPGNYYKCAIRCGGRSVCDVARTPAPSRGTTF
jgi:hypothetical protein